MIVHPLRASTASAVATIAVLVVGAMGLPAAEIHVTTYADEINSDGDCSLREAVQAANLDMAVDGCGAGDTELPDRIELSRGTYALTIRGFPEDANLAGDLDVINHLVIVGDPVAGSVIDGSLASDGDHVLDVLGGTVELRDLTVTGSRPNFNAQGSIEIDQGAELILRRCVVTDNQGTSGSFGILVNGRLEAHDSLITDNRAAMGAGIFCLGEATVELTRVTISNNRSNYGGGGIDCSGGSSLTLRNCRVTGNTTELGGSGSGAGVIAATHTVIEDSTIADNVTGFGGAAPGGGLWIRDDWVSISGTTISGNRAEPGAAVLIGSPLFGGFGRSIVQFENVTITGNETLDGSAGSVVVLENEALVWFNACTIAGNAGGLELAEGVEGLFAATVVAGGDFDGCRVDPLAQVTSLGDNLEDGSSCGFSHPSDLVDTDPLLGLLAGSGGLPQTLVPLIGSPLIDSASWAPAPGLDQRHVRRPQDGDGDGESIPDRGAVEYLGDVLFADGFERGGTWRWSTETIGAE